jgi:hypothetical protein
MKIAGLVRFAGCLTLLLLGVLALASPPAVHYHLLKKIPLGAAPGGREYFDYLTVDSRARRVYLSHGTEVKVVDADSGRLGRHDFRVETLPRDSISGGAR